VQCEQIRPLLDQYAEGTLPGYKVSWVVQHLAGCSDCTAAAGAARSVAQRQPVSASPRATARATVAAVAAVTAEAQRRSAETNLEDVRRPMPHWVRWVAVLLIAAAAGGAAWLFLGAPAPHQGPRTVSNSAQSDAIGRGCPTA
jgi:hypothetical protein